MKTEKSPCASERPLDLLVMRLRRYNEWRRGADFEQPEPAEIGRDIDAATRWLKQMGVVVEAARCICHWHDSGEDGMIVSAEHVRQLWQALADLDA